MNVVKNLVKSEKYHIKCPYPMEARFFVVHNTANDASARNEIAYMISNDLEVSYHYAIDNKEIVQGIPENRNAWHAGDGGNGKGNRYGIGIEICYSLSGGEKFVAAEKKAAKFIAEKLTERGWGIDHVKKHQDFDGKYCPHRTLDTGWERFLKMIEANLYVPGKLSGNDISRGTDKLVLYFKGLSGNGRTGTNMWGYEVAIDKNGVVLEDPHYSGDTKIPVGGKVLSGHGKAGVWLQERISLGDLVWFENGKTQIIKGLHKTVDSVDGQRYKDYLCVYRNGKKCPTNEWGTEVAIDKNGVAGKPVYGVGKMEIPEGGFVVSGHGKSSDWVLENINKGRTVTFNGKILKVM